MLQRATSLAASRVDLDEAYEVGKKAVEIAVTDGTGWMATILRRRDLIEYTPYFDKTPLELVANSFRHLPPAWISPDGLDVTDDFIRYARPLIGDGAPEIVIENGLQRFARLKIEFIDKKLPAYQPIRFRA